MNIVMPCAGAGKRFKEKGYTQPKPLINVLGQPLYKLSGSTFEGYFTYLVPVEWTGMFREEKVIPVSGLTEGAACTVLLSEPYIDPNDELLIINSDQLIEYNYFNFNVLRAQHGVDAIVFTFRATGNQWSYVAVDKTGWVYQAAEKRQISTTATVGAYYFKKAHYFFDAARKMIAAGDRTNGEYYVCPALNYLNKSIFAFEVDKMTGLGTPEDLEAYVDLHRT
jgi:NDP-sugar pyrophosphorylase family protein